MDKDSNDNIAAATLIRLINRADDLVNRKFDVNYKKWSKLKEKLGMLDYCDCFDGLSEILDCDGDVDLFKNTYQNEDLAQSLQVIMNKLSVKEYEDPFKG